MSAADTITVPAVGDHPEPGEFGPLTRTDFVKYQGASGDFHPLHHDEPYAVAAGLTLRFQEQCWPGDILTCTGTVTAVDPDDHGGHRVTVELACTRHMGGVAIAATAEFAIG